MIWWGLGIAVVLFSWLVWHLAVKDGPFEFMDLFIDHADNRASLAKVMITWLVLLSTWVVIVKVLGIYKVDGIETLLLGIISVFVGQVTVLAAVDKWKGDGSPPPFNPGGQGPYGGYGGSRPWYPVTRRREQDPSELDPKVPSPKNDPNEDG